MYDTKKDFVLTRKNLKNIEIFNEDCFQLMSRIQDDSIDMVLTDPPYFIDQMDDSWSSENIKRGQKKSRVVGGMPVGMKFDKMQSKRFFEFSMRCFSEYMRVIKPGGFVISFSQARLYHSLAMAAEMNDFEVRDMLGWCYEGQAKAFSQDHFIKKRKDISEEEKQVIIKALGGRKTPQLKPMIEPMVLAQKPKEGTYVENWLKHQVGLIDVSVSCDDKFPGNIFRIPKPSKQERGDGNNHPTVKPIRLLECILKIFTVEGALILDPFMGSGSTAVAAKNTYRRSIGSEIDPGYYELIKNRLGIQ